MVVASRSGGAERIQSGEQTEIGDQLNQRIGATLQIRNRPPRAAQ